MPATPFRPRSSYPAWTTITTRWHDNDHYGHVNNVVYYSWFDTAVNGWLIANGLLDLHDGDRIGLVVASGCDYAAALAFPQAVEIGVAVARIGTSSVTYHLGVFAEGAEDAAAQGHFTHVYVTGAERKAAPLPEAWRTALSAIAAR